MTPSKATMLAALERLDVPIDEFIGRDAVKAAASKAMSKKNPVPKAMAWLDPAVLPTLHWHDGEPVDIEVVTYLLANAVKGKSAEPSPIVRRHFSAMNTREVGAFGRVLLDYWITEDLRTYDHADALAEAQLRAPNYLAWAQRGGGPYANMTQEQITNKLYDELLVTVSGSATTSKGLLAVVAASAGGEVADKALAYIRRHRGQRASQAKALLQMLAWIDGPGRGAGGHGGCGSVPTQGDPGRGGPPSRTPRGTQGMDARRPRRPQRARWWVRGQRPPGVRLRRANRHRLSRR